LILPTGATSTRCYALFPRLTIYENISFGLMMKKVPPAEITKRVDRVVEMISLHDFVSRKPAQLLWQRQHVALARAIVSEPKVLLLDDLPAAFRQKGKSERLTPPSPHLPPARIFRKVNSR
jgi:ABC-type Fe3+/spermidine/putrescine transport system ATPase subunit